MALLCLSLTGRNHAENRRAIERWRDRIDLVELRADFLDPDELDGIGRFGESLPMPAILTARRPADGGRWRGSEQTRLALLESGAGSGYAYIDIEEDTYLPGIEESASRGKIRIIRSLHDVSGMPAGLPERVRSLVRRPTDIAKIACTPGSTADFLEIVKAYEDTADVDRILIGMGVWGFAVRILAGKLGSFLGFASPEGGSAAPGHVTPGVIEDLYGFRRIGRDTDVYCVIGNPVAHSRSPDIHNPALRARGINAVYVPITVDDVGLFLGALDLLGVRGISVTVPHKETVIPLLDSRDDSVDRAGSCNTVTVRNGLLRGVNTDVPGFLASLRGLTGGMPLEGLRAGVIGAGGTARAVCAALTGAGCMPAVFNRSVPRGRALAAEFGLPFFPLESGSAGELSARSDLIVQTTKAGMEPDIELDPLGFYDFTGREMVYEVIYAPPSTKMLSRAAAAGCAVKNGWDMLLEQAYLQFELFTGIEFPETVKRSLQSGQGA